MRKRRQAAKREAVPLASVRPWKPARPKGEVRAAIVSLLLDRDGPRCHWCRRPLGSDISIEHLRPLSRGGGNDLDNLALAHRGCNK